MFEKVGLISWQFWHAPRDPRLKVMVVRFVEDGRKLDEKGGIRGWRRRWKRVHEVVQWNV